MKLSGKSAIVTGGASGIGQATSRLFAEEGASVVIADFSEAGEEHAKRLRDDGHQAIFFKVDVTKEDQIQELIEHTVHAFGKLDIMFANAGVANDDPADRLSLEKWQKTIDVNLTGVFLSDKYALIQMLKQGTGGAIVNTASIHGHAAKAGVTAYGSSKGGVVMLTQTLGIQYAPEVSASTRYAPAISKRRCLKCCRRRRSRSWSICIRSAVSERRKRWPKPSCSLPATTPRS
ncbi:Glucose 1-dehydrogenase 4 [Paenibacillus sp. P1XP2]|nr:Glucose 1-dehydrogenase 4 [Paenibacillus sp. P1XP2]